MLTETQIQAIVMLVFGYAFGCLTTRIFLSAKHAKEYKDLRNRYENIFKGDK